jgi:hypothetical protein
MRVVLVHLGSYSVVFPGRPGNTTEYENLSNIWFLQMSVKPLAPRPSPDDYCQDSPAFYYFSLLLIKKEV